MSTISLAVTERWNRVFRADIPPQGSRGDNVDTAMEPVRNKPKQAVTPKPKLCQNPVPYFEIRIKSKGIKVTTSHSPRLSNQESRAQADCGKKIPWISSKSSCLLAQERAGPVSGKMRNNPVFLWARRKDFPKR